jgi:hypothetical protein
LRELNQIQIKDKVLLNQQIKYTFALPLR